MTREEAEKSFREDGFCNLCGNDADAVINFGERYGTEDWESTCINCFHATEPWLQDHYNNKEA